MRYAHNYTHSQRHHRKDMGVNSQNAVGELETGIFPKASLYSKLCA